MARYHRRLHPRQAHARGRHYHRGKATQGQQSQVCAPTSKSNRHRDHTTWGNAATATNGNLHTKVDEGFPVRSKPLLLHLIQRHTCIRTLNETGRHSGTQGQNRNRTRTMVRNTATAEDSQHSDHNGFGVQRPERVRTCCGRKTCGRRFKHIFP